MSGLIARTADQAIEHLLQLHPKGYDLSLDRILGLLAKLGNPQDKLPPVIHVAGTNGKGSFTAFARAMLEAEGYLVHVHTSPHLVRWHERFRIGATNGGQFVEDDVLLDAVNRVAEANQNAPITVFEILSAVTFLLFSEHPADVVLLEVGLGGRFDATNVISKAAANVIMPVSLDHQAFLGDTIAKIAFEKAGIIKDKTPVIVAPQTDEALDVIVQQAEKRRCPISVFGQDFAGSQEHGCFVYQDEFGLIDLPMPQLKGAHQISNAATAIRACRDAGFAISDSALERAMQRVYWPGRMQNMPHGSLSEIVSSIGADIYLDGGHNRDAAKVAAQTITQMSAERPIYMIAAMLDTKEPEPFFGAFNGIVQKCYTVPIITSDSGISADNLAHHAAQAGLNAAAATNVQHALTQICQEHQKTGTDIAPVILICGSLYVVGDVLAQNGTPPQ